MRDILPRQGLCKPLTGELQFFNHECFAPARRPVEAEERETYFAEWRHCRGVHTLNEMGLVRGSGFDKSPATYIQPWIPLRVCQALPPRQKILLLLREPVARAFSGYHQCRLTRMAAPLQLRADHMAARNDTPHDFSVAAALEVDVARRCSPWGTGDPERDIALGEAFSTCCTRVAQEHGLRAPSNWPLCSTTPHCATGKHVGPHRRMAISKGGTFGQWCYTHVLAGVYVRYLRLWYRHHHPRDVLLVRSEDFFANQSGVVDELMSALLGPNRSVSKPVIEVRSAEATKGAEMHSETRRMLQRFYAPFNAELDELLGLKIGWTYDL